MRQVAEPEHKYPLEKPLSTSHDIHKLLIRSQQVLQPIDRFQAIEMIFPFSLATLVTSTVALPSTLQRRFTGGSCGIHINQHSPAPESDYYQIGITVFDGAGTNLGVCTSCSEDPNEPIYCQPGDLPWQMKCTSNSETHDCKLFGISLAR